MSEKLSRTLADTAKLAEDFLRECPEGAIVALRGELGAGKTTFVRHVIEDLVRHTGAAPTKVTSPSYVIHQSYPALIPSVDHFDFYRLNLVNEEALLELGYLEVLERRARSKGYVFIEWAERASPEKVLEVNYQISIRLEVSSTGETKRYFEMKPRPFR